MNNRKNIIDNLINFLQEEGYQGIQAFNTRNLAGDKMYTVYNDGNILVDYCPIWTYIEIFGLTEKEFNEIVPGGPGEYVL